MWGVQPLFFCFLLLFSAKTFGLFGYQVRIVEVIDLHGTAYIVQCSGSRFTSLLTAFFQHVVDSRYILFEFLAAGTDGLQCFLHVGIREVFLFYTAQTATLVVSLQLVEIGVIRQIAFKVFGAAECVEVSKYGIAFHLTRILYTKVIRDRLHAAYFFLYFVSGVTQVDAVPQTFAHFRFTVRSRQTQAGGIVR